MSRFKQCRVITTKDNHYYICFDQDLQEGDTIIITANYNLNDTHLDTVISEDSNKICCKIYTYTKDYYTWHKVIATTDKSLNLPGIDEKTLRRIDRESIKEVMVKYTCEEVNCFPIEPNKCKNCRSKYLNPINKNNIINIKLGERTYTEEEVEVLLYSAFHFGQDSKTATLMKKDDSTVVIMYDFESKEFTKWIKEILY